MRVCARGAHVRERARGWDAMGRRGLESHSLQDWLRLVGQASTELHSSIFPDIPVKESAICCCGMAKASAKAYRELWLASEALSEASHGAEDGNHSHATVVASQKVESAMRRLEPLAELDKKDILVEEGPKDAPDVDSVQSANRREIGDDDEASKPKVEMPAGSSSFPLLPVAVLAPMASAQLARMNAGSPPARRAEKCGAHRASDSERRRASDEGRQRGRRQRPPARTRAVVAERRCVDDKQAERQVKAPDFF